MSHLGHNSKDLIRNENYFQMILKFAKSVRGKRIMDHGLWKFPARPDFYLLIFEGAGPFTLVSNTSWLFCFVYSNSITATLLNVRTVLSHKVGLRISSVVLSLLRLGATVTIPLHQGATIPKEKRQACAPEYVLHSHRGFFPRCSGRGTFAPEMMMIAFINTLGEIM